MQSLLQRDYQRDVLLNVVVSLGLTAAITFVLGYFVLFGD